MPATQAAYDAMLTAVAPELTAAELTTLRSLSFGDNAETGTGGSGVFTYAAGSFVFEIKETAGAGNATTATLVLGAGIDAAQLAATADAQGDLLVTDGIAGDQIKLDWDYAAGRQRRQRVLGGQMVRFADGTTWTAEPFVGGSAARRGGAGVAQAPLATWDGGGGLGAVSVGAGGRAGGRVWCCGAPPRTHRSRFAAQAPARGEGEDGAAAPCKAGPRRRR